MIGGEIGVDELAAAAGTIGYDVLTSLGHRYHASTGAPERRLIPRVSDFLKMFLYCSHRPISLSHRYFPAIPDVETQSDLRLPELRRGFSRWQGKCEACGEWNTLSEEGAAAPVRPRP